MIGTEFIPGQGLGNQLLCYVTARCIALEHGVPFGLVRGELLGNVLHSQRGMYFMDIDLGERIAEEDRDKYNRYDEKETRLFIGNSQHDMTHGCYVADADPALHTLPDDTLIYGNMQSEDYFGKYRDEVRSWLKLRPEADSHEYTRDNLCIINMRGGEYADSPELFLDRSYWLHAIRHMKQIRPDMEFMVVTEDVESAKKVLPEFECHHFDMGKDYATVHNARYLILSNSSFAVMPAFTSETLQYAIAPKYWARHNVSDGYWASGQNIYSFLDYLDRKGNIFTAKECREEWEAYKESSPLYASHDPPLTSEQVKKGEKNIKKLRRQFRMKKALRKAERMLHCGK